MLGGISRRLVAPVGRGEPATSTELAQGPDQADRLVDEYRVWLAAKRAAVPALPTDEQTVREIRAMIRLGDADMVKASHEAHTRHEALKRDTKEAEEQARSEYEERFKPRIASVLPSSTVTQRPASLEDLDAIGQELERIVSQSAAAPNGQFEVDKLVARDPNPPSGASAPPGGRR